MVVDDLRAAFLTSGLSDEQLSELMAVGQETPFKVGDELFREGEPADLLWILLEGQIWNSCAGASTRRFVLATMSTPGQWAGGLRAWGDASSSAGYRATGIAVTDGRMFTVPSDDLGRLVGEWFPFGKHMVIGVYQTVRGIEAAARQRESLVALGTLAAGLAHEINNPAAASLRAVEGLRKTTRRDALVARHPGATDHHQGAIPRAGRVTSRADGSIRRRRRRRRDHGSRGSNRQLAGRTWRRRSVADCPDLRVGRR